MQTRPVELVRVTAADGVRLDAALERARNAEAKPPAQLVILFPGTGGNFYSSTFLEALADIFLASGAAVLRANTRGHDIVNSMSTRGGPLRQGAAYEVMDESRYDVNAWVEWATQAGFASVGLAGHSAGAIKIIYSQALEPHPAVRYLIALSPPRLSYASFLQSDVGETFAASMREAEAMVAEGKGDALMEVRIPIRLLITAAGYIEKYGPDERYNLLRYLPRVGPPVLFIYGEVELKSATFESMPASINALNLDCVQVAEIERADHFYRGCYDELGEQLQAWLKQLD